MRLNVLNVPGVVPRVCCHRVVGAGLGLVGFNGKGAAGNLDRKARLLKEEGVPCKGTAVDPDASDAVML